MASMAASLHGTSSYASPSCMANNIARALSVSERGGAAGHFPARFCFFTNVPCYSLFCIGFHYVLSRTEDTYWCRYGT